MFDRLEKIIGKENISKLNNSNILIIGLGGVGGLATETLIRNGIQNITIIDNDTIEISNKNRQIIALDSTINMYKTDAFELRIKDINKNVNINKITEFINEDNIELLFKEKYDYVIDACDTVDTKVLLIKECLKRNIPIISSMGMGKKMDITKIKIMDIKDTSYDKLAKVIRKKLKEEGINNKIPVLSSDEQPMNTENVIGSYSPLVNTAGIMLADYVIKEIIK